MYLSSSDLELVFDNGDQMVGLRFNGMTIPPGAEIVNAYIQFQADETHSEATSLIIEGEAADHAETFNRSFQNISLRDTTENFVLWNPAAWTAVGEAGPDQQTPPLTSIIQEIVGRPGWASGNSLAFIISGTGERVAESFKPGKTDAAPLLHVEYR